MDIFTKFGFVSKLRCLSIPVISYSCISLVVIMFGLTLHRAISLDMDLKPGYWAIDVIPAALSKLAFKHKIKYTENTTVRNVFQNALTKNADNLNNVNISIAETLRIPKDKISNVYNLLSNDDKGIVDFVTMAFKVFGLKAQSILYFYFLILFFSSVFYSITNFHFPGRLTFLVAFFIMLYLILPMARFNEQLGNVLALRALPVLSMVACFHCILFVLQSKDKIRDLILLTLQVVIILFVIHLRTTAQWQIYIIGLTGVSVILINLIFKKSKEKSDFFNRVLPLFPLLFIVLGSVMLHGYRNIAFKAYDNSNMPITRVFWHSIFSGLAFEPGLANRYQLRVDDLSIYAATKVYLSEIGRNDQWSLITENNPNSQVPIRWDEYDHTVKEMLFARCKSFPISCLSATFYYKPLSMFKQLAWLYGLEYLPADIDLFISEYFGDIVKTQVIQATKEMDATNMRAILWSPIVVFLLIPFILLFFLHTDITVVYGAIILSFGSFIPTIVGYPAPHTILEPAISVGVMFYCTVWFILRRTLRTIFCSSMFSSKYHPDNSLIKNKCSQI